MFMFFYESTREFWYPNNNKERKWSLSLCVWKKNREEAWHTNHKKYLYSQLLTRDKDSIPIKS